MGATTPLWKLDGWELFSKKPIYNDGVAPYRAWDPLELAKTLCYNQKCLK